MSSSSIQRLGAASVVALLASGCVPSFEPFTVIEPGEDGGPPRFDGGGPSDGGARSDAGAQTDAGDAREDAGAGGCASVLECATSCDDVVGGALLDETFDAVPLTFRNLRGAFDVNMGDLVLLGGSTETAITESNSAFSDVVSCADVALPAMRPMSALHEMGHSLRGMQHGLTCYVDAARGRVVMFSLNPGGNALIAMQQPSWLGTAVELRMLVYLSGTTGHCEVQNLAGGDVTVLDGTYGGDSLPVNVHLDGMATDDIRVHRILTGTPSVAARLALP